MSALDVAVVTLAVTVGACVQGSVGFGFDASRAFAAMIIPGVQNPHWVPPFSRNAAWMGWSLPPGSDRPSIVSIDTPAARRMR